MAGNVNKTVGTIVVDDARVAALKMIDDTVDLFLVAWDDTRREEDGVARIDFCELVVIDSSARERGHRLALGARNQDAELVGRGVADLVGVDDQALRRVDVPEILRDFGGVIQRAANDSDFASMLVGEIHRDADAVDGGREAGEEKLLRRGGKDVVQTRDNGFFAGCEAGAVDVGGVLQEAKNALLAKVGEGLEVEWVTVRG